MSTTICFDFGNTRLKAAIFTNASLIELRVLETGSIQEIEKLVAEFAPGICSGKNHFIFRYSSR